MHHYVYRTSMGKSFYIGCRSSKKPPEEDAKYLGSGMWILCSIHYVKPIKEILSIHENRELAEREESRLIVEHYGSIWCRNAKRTKCRRYSIV